MPTKNLSLLALITSTSIFASHRIELVPGDVAKQDTEVIVNAANPWLTTGGGIAGAIHSAAGPELEAYCTDSKNFPIVDKDTGYRCKYGDAVITPSFKLKNSGIERIIHAVGPDCRIQTLNKAREQLLQHVYQTALTLFKKSGYTSISFSSLSTGIFACPLAESAEIAAATIIEFLKNEKSPMLVRFVLWKTDPKFDENFTAYEQAFQKQLHAQAQESITFCAQKSIPAVTQKLPCLPSAPSTAPQALARLHQQLTALTDILTKHS